MSNLATLAGGRLRVDFQRVGDRIEHTISAVNGCHVTPLLRSLEGTPQQTWPASPALQELHLERRGTEVELALLVGMAGTSHWSASVGLDRSTQTLHFDIACRVKDTADHLGTTYEILTESVGGNSADFQFAAPFGGVVVRSDRTSMVQIENSFRITPVIEVPPTLPGTFRWQYFVTAILA